LTIKLTKLIATEDTEDIKKFLEVQKPFYKKVFGRRRHKKKMLLKNFDELMSRVKSLPKKRVVVAAAADEKIIKLAKAIDAAGIADCLLVGNRDKIQSLAKGNGTNIKPDHIVHVETSDEKAMAEKAVSLIKENQADLIMKGHLHTAVFLKAVLNDNGALRGNGLLSQASVFEKMSGNGLLLISDCAMNICPNLDQKRQIIKNSVKLAGKIGYPKPLVAILAAVETVNPEMPETTDAAVLSKMGERGQLGNCVIDGPLALDNAVSMESARHKGINSPVAGKADILIVPDIRTGNVLHKSLVYFAKKKVAAVIMGANIPIIFPSRTDFMESKLLSVALAAYLSRNNELT